MLAYVFWHSPKPDIDPEDYIQKLRAFHDSLNAHAPEGFSRSIVFELTNPPWLTTEGVAFEDWYLLEDSAALDKLNFAAVSGENEKPHNRVAADAANGTAGLYRLRQGDIDGLRSSRLALWFSKSPNVSYPDLYSELEPLASNPGVGVWCRQMTLGPTPEFCLRSVANLILPRAISTEAYPIRVKTVWGT
jgi:hypothetical protein